jgi:CBS domain-containing protein
MTNRPMLEIMVRREPVTLPPGATVLEAARTMRERRVGAVLVTGPDGALLGIFTGRDAVWRMLAENRDPARTTLAEAMTQKPGTIGPRAKAIEALRLMQDCGVRHLPVVDEARLIGVVSRGDFRGSEQARLDDETALWERL